MRLCAKWVTEVHSQLQIFEFLALPAEIRNMIYWIVLVKTHSHPSVHFRFRQPPLTLVNKQIRSESLPVFYGNGQFKIYFGRPYDFKRLQKRWAGPQAMPNLTHITKLDIRFPFGPTRSSDGDVLHLYIVMRKSKSGRSTVRNKILVCGPGFEGKDISRIRHVYECLRITGDPYLSTPEGFESAYEGKEVAVRALLYFAEKCPAAAEWIWMALKIDRRSD